MWTRRVSARGLAEGVAPAEARREVLAYLRREPGHLSSDVDWSWLGSCRQRDAWASVLASLHGETFEVIPDDLGLDGWRGRERKIAELLARLDPR